MKSSSSKYILLLSMPFLLAGSLAAEDRNLSTSKFAEVYFQSLLKQGGAEVVGEVGNSLRPSVREFLASTFSFEINMDTANRTYFNDKEVGRMALIVLETPASFEKIFGGFDNVITSGVLRSKVLTYYVVCANGDYCVIMLSEQKRIPVGARAVKALVELLPRVGLEY